MKNPSTELMGEFYQQLGKFFFLVANADNHIHQDEIKVLKKIINDVWLDEGHTSNQVEMDTGRQIEYMFDDLIKNPKSENLLFTEIRTFVSSHKSLFTTKANILIVGTAQAIADAFAGTNKDERRILDKIKSIIS